MSKNISEYKYTPEERELEYKLVREERRLINKMDISEEEKIKMLDGWFNYLLAYDNEYNKRQKKLAIFKSLSTLN